VPVQDRHSKRILTQVWMILTERFHACRDPYRLWRIRGVS
jgi:hypothetical protein